MEVAAQAELQRGDRFLLQAVPKLVPQLIEKPRKIGAIVDIAIISMRRGYDMGNAVRRRHAAHFDGYLPGLGAIVNFGQNVAVDVDHEVVFRPDLYTRSFTPENSATLTLTIRTHPATKYPRPPAHIFASRHSFGTLPAHPNQRARLLRLHPKNAAS